MKGEKLELVRGSGNVFRDLGRENADIEQLKALLAAEIIRLLDREELTVRAAHARTGFAAADFSRIRNANLGRFTADRLMSVLNRRGSRVEVKIRVRPLEPVRGSEARAWLPASPVMTAAQVRAGRVSCAAFLGLGSAALVWSGRGDWNARPLRPRH
jgi:predicted XRE-type DNA-binding protein